MKIGFVYAAFENLGIEYMSAMLKKHGHETFLIFDPQIYDDLYMKIPILSKMFNYQEYLFRQIGEKGTEVLMFSVVSDLYTWCSNFAKEAKRRYPHITVIFGGPHISAVADLVLKNKTVDFIINGEGEYAIVELIEALQNKNHYEDILNVGYRKGDQIIVNPCRPLIQDLDALPFPDTDLFIDVNPYAHKEYNIITARGCTFNCSYCHNSVERKYFWNNEGKYLRKRSIENILAELEERKEKYMFNTICFWDEVFTSDEEWLQEFCKEYKKRINVPFWAFVHPKHITAKSVKLLEDAGCWEVEMGIQTLNQRVKKQILNRPESKDDIINAIDLLGKSKINVVVDVIFGLPYVTEEDYWELIDLFAKYKVNRIQTFWLRYYPKTRILDYVLEQGLITKEEYLDINEGVPTNAAASGGSTRDKRFEKFQTMFAIMPYLPKFIIKRIITKKKIPTLPGVSGFGHLFTRIFDITKKHDVGGRRYKGRLIYFTMKGISKLMFKQHKLKQKLIKSNIDKTFSQ